ncbi:hypothetical protein [Prosthecobacter dejongeii]|uniref:Uncharacterized protein n=1 Tax=Prosthecobacter dejongeii TaxID=48465 RepID=A0A7W7YJ11_9BACT|nr:hypothetical protein [Prosthecobacter dejongeii]MBB5037111.1 hypothetical protein [Prosthecobacter dejongeii]
MTLSALLIALEDTLQPLMADAGGVLAVADTEYDALESLTQAADRWRVVMVPGGNDSMESGDDVGGYVSDQIHFYVTAPLGLAANPSKGLHRSKPNATPSFLARLEWLMREVRGLTVDDESLDQECGRAFRFGGWDWVRVEGMPWRAARVRFTVRYVLTDTDGPDPLPPIMLRGVGYLPPGGAPGQVIVKTGPGDFEVAWGTPAEGLAMAVVGNYLHITDGDGVTKRVRMVEL